MKPQKRYGNAVFGEFIWVPTADPIKNYHYTNK